MFGSDSAPHPQSAKESSHCSAGVFTAPIALQLLAQLFEKNNSLENLQKFVSDNAREIYSLSTESFSSLNLEKKDKIRSIPEKIITLEKKEFIIPKKYGEVVPFMAGEKINWSII